MERVEMAVSNVGHIPVLLDSLCFLLMRHGFHKTLEFIRTLIKLAHPLVVPVPVDALSIRQNLIFEDPINGTRLLLELQEPVSLMHASLLFATVGQLIKTDGTASGTTLVGC